MAMDRTKEMQDIVTEIDWNKLTELSYLTIRNFMRNYSQSLPKIKKVKDEKEKSITTQS